MANVKLVFYGSESVECDSKTITAYVNSNQLLYVLISDLDVEYHGEQYTVLDKPTAVRLVRELKRINHG